MNNSKKIYFETRSPTAIFNLCHLYISIDRLTLFHFPLNDLPFLLILFFGSLICRYVAKFRAVFWIFGVFV